MGFRFRQGLRIFPGLRLNLSKSGVSASLGRRGATLNIGRRGIRGTVGLPGSGLSYSQMLYEFDRRTTAPTAEQGAAPDTTDLLSSGGEEVYRAAVRLVTENVRASASWLQRQLRIDYGFASRLIDRMESEGIVSPADWLGRRKVLSADLSRR